eukprot:CAMPEP_0114495526 /NCGR_PEP_ID=MMETSP0109-20121206/5260_1 /TAXON_ID=29199 /ORGANISM="Chlorarachnion reptans, Strain CCCM449" /LENGTH=270 /DNA_ID=CAMNT_0001672691 /DNA_START=113 /DNA_END=925 /DNA_ORIENTATION=+
MRAKALPTIADGFGDERLPKSAAEAIEIASDNLVDAFMKKPQMLHKVVLRRGEMIRSPKEELKAAYAISTVLSQKGDLGKLYLVVPKAEMRSFLNRDAPGSVKVVDLDSLDWTQDDIDGLVFANLDEFSYRGARLAAQTVTARLQNIPIVIANPKMAWKDREGREFAARTMNTPFFMEQGEDESNGTVMITCLGDDIWQAWNIKWSPTGGDYTLLLQQSTQPTNDEIVAAVFDMTKEKLWDETWDGFFDMFNLKGATREKAKEFVKRFGA